MTRVWAIVAGIVVVAALGAAFLVTSNPFGPDDRFAQCRGSAVAGGGDIGGPFELVNGDGESVTDAEVLDRPSLVYFGYTFCPDVCPFDVVRNAEAVDILQERGHDVQPVFISIDPERDTPDVVGAYAANMHEDMIGLTGSAEQVRTASQAYRTYYAKRESGDDYYLVDHSTFTYLMLPDHGFAEFFRRELSPEEMAERTACFLDAA